MVFLKTAMATVAALSLMAVPTMAAAQSASASKLSVAGARVGAVAKGKSKQVPGAFIIGALALVAVGGAVYIAADSDDEPDSN